MSNDYSLVAFRPENKDIYPRREYDVIPDLHEFRNAYKWIARYKPSIFSNITSEALEDLYSAVINKKINCSNNEARIVKNFIKEAQETLKDNMACRLSVW